MTTRGVRGAGEGAELPEPKKSKKAVDSDSFKDIMDTGKVREVDPEEKRKRKQKQEAETEATANQIQAAPNIPIQPQSADSTEDGFKINLSALSAGPPSATPDEYSEEDIDTNTSYYTQEEEETPPMQQAAPPPPAPAPAESFFPDEGLLPQEEDMTVAQPERQPQDQTEQPQAPKSSQKAKKKTTPEDLAKVSSAKKANLAPKAPKPAAPQTTAKKGEIPAFSDKKEAFVEKLAGAPPKKEEVEEIAKDIEPIANPLPQGSWEKAKIKEEEKIETVQAAPSGAAPGILTPMPEVIPPPPTPFAPYATLHPQVWDLFERMVGVMTIMQTSGISETTINLTGDQFKSSPFFGTQIVIKEFSTAPKNFNIEIMIPSQVTKTVQQNYNDLVAAFQAGNYNFKVNRLEWRELPAEEKKRKVVRSKRKKEEEE